MMSHLDVQPDEHHAAVLGYLNFSAGHQDAAFIKHLDAVARKHGFETQGAACWSDVRLDLLAALQVLQTKEQAFADGEQAQAVIELAFVQVPRAYQTFHAELLHHRPDRDWLNPYFMARICEAVLTTGGPWDAPDRVVRGALRELNNFLGYRPLPQLANGRAADAYPHEKVGLIPLLIPSLGGCAGPYQALVEAAWEILLATDADLLHQAGFDPKRITELSLDPRAYDFDHVVHQRPNYLFGEWDPQALDSGGYFHRFVLRSPPLDFLLERLQTGGPATPELLFESAAVLAGTILMASGTTGEEPAAYGSDITLATLVPKIAAYRDSFYEKLLARRMTQSPEHGTRLRQEADVMHQPFGSVRNELNRHLAGLRARQRLNTELAYFHAALGYAEEAERQAAQLNVPSARLIARIRVLLQTSERALAAGGTTAALVAVRAAESVLKQGIQCGALVDPWNGIGFAGQFPLFPSVENSVSDRRFPVLIQQVRRILQILGQCWGVAAALPNGKESAETAPPASPSAESSVSTGGATALPWSQLSSLGSTVHWEQVVQQAAEVGLKEIPTSHAEVATSAELALKELARWWDQFATAEVAALHSFSAASVYRSAQQVARHVKAWREQGGNAGDVAFWRPRVAELESSEAFSRIVETLLSHHDYLAAMAVMLPWLSQAQDEPTTDPMGAFQRCVQSWLGSVLSAKEPIQGRPGWETAAKFLAYLEANAEDFWEVPAWDGLSGLNPRANRQSPGSRDPRQETGSGDGTGKERNGDADEDEDGDQNPYQAAYEGFIFRDSADDGNDASMLESGEAAQLPEWELAARRLARRLSFFQLVAWVWKTLADFPHLSDTSADLLDTWLTQAIVNRRQLQELADALYQERVPKAVVARWSVLQGERRQEIKDSLLEKVVATVVDTHEAAVLLSARLTTLQPRQEARIDIEIEVTQATWCQDALAVRHLFPALTEHLLTRSLLYLPISRGGEPRKVAEARCLMRMLEYWLKRWPHLGLLSEVGLLLDTMLRMERMHSPGPGASTEYDRLFQLGYRHLMLAIIRAAPKRKRVKQEDFVNTLDSWAQTLLARWLDHSRSLRLSATERLLDGKTWNQVKAFIENYGQDLFVPAFMSRNYLRALNSMGLDKWLRKLEEPDSGEDPIPRFVQDLGGKLDRKETLQTLTMIIDSVLEFYSHYREYNYSASLSDRGEMLHVLLSFLRLRASYDRVTWHLTPVLQTHELMVREGRYEAAELWRQSLFARTIDAATEHLRRYQNLCKQFGIQLPGVFQRLNERFVRPLIVDRLRSLVRQARFQAERSEDCQVAFGLLRQELDGLLKDETLGGEESPFWLEELRQELERVQEEEQPSWSTAEPLMLSWDNVMTEFHRWISRETEDKLSGGHGDEPPAAEEGTEGISGKS